MKFKVFALATVTITCLSAQSVGSTALFNSPGKDWPTYNGDYSGRRYSALSQIGVANVRSLALGWAFQTHAAATVKCTPLMVNGVLYFTLPEHVWAVDARTGRQIWHFHRPSDTVSAPLLLEWVAGWVIAGGQNLNKPTHFEVADGRF